MKKNSHLDRFDSSRCLVDHDYKSIIIFKSPLLWRCFAPFGAIASLKNINFYFYDTIVSKSIKENKIIQEYFLIILLNDYTLIVTKKLKLIFNKTI